MTTYFSNLYIDNREWIKFVIKWFGFAMFVGGVAYLVKPDLINQIIDIFQSKFGPEPAVDINLAREIFIQNSIACVIALLGGLLFGITSFLTIFFNGFIIGFVIVTLLTASGNPLRNLEYVILGLAPHGIFELPAFFLASALGIRLGTEWVKKENAGIRSAVFKQNLIRVIYSLPVLLILLIIAALVEVFISGQFVNNF